MKTLCLTFVLLVKISVIFAKLPDVCPKIIKKSEWGGRSPTKVEYTIIPLEYVIIHHTNTPECLDQRSCSEAIVNMQADLMDKLFLNDIPYNFLIGGDGNVYEGAGWHREGAHANGYNAISLGFAFIGNFTRNAPTAKQLEAGRKLLECAVALKELEEQYGLLPAYSIWSTESPGVMLAREIVTWEGFSEFSPIQPTIAGALI